jgi:hypothetical protein
VIHSLGVQEAVKIAAPGGSRKVRARPPDLSPGPHVARFLDYAVRFLPACPTMRRSLIALIALFAAAPAAAQPTQAAAAQDGGTYRSSAGFILDLPAGWVRAPESAVEEVSRASGTLPPGLTYEAVFQTDRARWPAPPFAAIARGAAPDWLTPEEFRRRGTAGRAQALLQSRANRTDTLSTGRVGMRLGIPWWDETNRAAWMRAEIEATGGFSWTVTMLHPSGGWMILIQYYAAAGADEEQVLAQLDGVIRSLRVD